MSIGRKRLLKFWASGIIFLFILPTFALGLLDPATVYCTNLGYNYTATETGENCKLPDGSSVDAWSFLLGEVGNEYSYCKRMGYEIKVVSDAKTCEVFLTEKCAVCILGNGTEVEVTKLMGLNFKEGTCGDGVCVVGESYENCPQDCISGSFDAYCDGVSDKNCDQDCLIQGMPKRDPDCPVCGNEVCEEKETYNCPQDCPKVVVCGNGACEAGETRENCCTDCDCPEGEVCKENKCVKEKCGNKACEPKLGENYKTCPKDCHSGSRDDYCDGVMEGICDPDCPGEGDVDCLKKPNLLVYGIIGSVVAFLVAVILVKSRQT